MPKPLKGKIGLNQQPIAGQVRTAKFLNPVRGQFRRRNVPRIPNDSAGARQMVDIGRRRTASTSLISPHCRCFMDGLDALDGSFLIKEKGESVVAYRADGTTQELSLDAPRKVPYAQNRRRKGRPGRPQAKIFRSLNSLSTSDRSSIVVRVDGLAVHQLTWRISPSV
jgi:hypothetical protein